MMISIGSHLRTHFVLIASLVSTVVLTTPSVYAAAPTADEIVKKADEGRLPQGTLSFTATVVDFENSKKEHESRYHVLNKSNDASLVETVFPERQQGRKLLMEGNSLWFYTPDIKRAARVSMQQKLTGEIANGDLVRTNFAGDYSAKIINEETINGVVTYHLDLKAKHEGVTYSRLQYWVSKNEFLPVKAVFYAVSGKVLKTGTFSDPKVIMGHKIIKTESK